MQTTVLKVCWWAVAAGRRIRMVFVLKSVGDRLYAKGYLGVGSQSRNLTAREPPWKQDGLPPMVNIMWIASAESRNVRGASHQPIFMGDCLTICHTYLPSLAW